MDVCHAGIRMHEYSLLGLHLRIDHHFKVAYWYTVREQGNKLYVLYCACMNIYTL